MAEQIDSRVELIQALIPLGLDAHFGASAASIGDVNDDTVPDLIVGAPGQDVAGNPGQGQAYIISGDNAELLFTLDNPTP